MGSSAIMWLSRSRLHKNDVYYKHMKSSFVKIECQLIRGGNGNKITSFLFTLSLFLLLLFLFLLVFLILLLFLLLVLLLLVFLLVFPLLVFLLVFPLLVFPLLVLRFALLFLRLRQFLFVVSL